MKNILLVGAGQIGSRHLQGLMKISLQVRIGVIDPSEENLNIAADRAKQVEQAGNVKELLFWKSLSEITFSEIDFAIIATNSDIRPEIISDLLHRLRVHNILMEKVVFQSIKTFKEQIQLLESSGVKSWVNCPRRIYPFYKNLKDELNENEKISITVSGSNWGLGCNSIHFIDLFYFLTSEKDCKLDYVSLEPEILQSKRKGFVEFRGKFGFSNSKGSLNLNSVNISNIPVIIEILTPEKRLLISESQGNVICFNAKDNFKPQFISERFPYQSELTNIIAEEILTYGECGLADIKESLSQHIAILQPFNNHILAVKGTIQENCPIT